MKSALKTQDFSSKHFKKVKFEDTDDEFKEFESIAKRTFQCFKMSVQKSPSYFSPRNGKRSPRFTLNDLKKL
jgi:hypothetical protein